MACALHVDALPREARNFPAVRASAEALTVPDPPAIDRHQFSGAVTNQPAQQSSFCGLRSAEVHQAVL